ncbi:hypothetical protein ACFL5U_00060 [Candidatus Margulisiibacteriota bacterium]
MVAGITRPDRNTITAQELREQHPRFRCHVITPFAFRTLAQNPSLFRELLSHFNGSRSIRPGSLLDGRLRANRLIAVPIAGKNPRSGKRTDLFYALRGTSADESRTLDELLKHMNETPSEHDLIFQFGLSDIDLSFARPMTEAWLRRLNSIADYHFLRTLIEGNITKVRVSNGDGHHVDSGCLFIPLKALFTNRALRNYRMSLRQHLGLPIT